MSLLRPGVIKQHKPNQTNLYTVTFSIEATPIGQWDSPAIPPNNYFNLLLTIASVTTVDCCFGLSCLLLLFNNTSPSFNKYVWCHDLVVDLSLLNIYQTYTTQYQMTFIRISSLQNKFSHKYENSHWALYHLCDSTCMFEYISWQ